MTLILVGVVLLWLFNSSYGAALSSTNASDSNEDFFASGGALASTNATNSSEEFFVVDPAPKWKNYTEIACSFLQDDQCSYENLNELPDQPRWTVTKFEPQNYGCCNPIYGGYRIWQKGSENFPIEQPPLAQYFIQTGPTTSSEFHGKFSLLASPLIRISDTDKCLCFSYHNRAPFTMIPTLEVRIRSENATKDTVLAEYFQTDASKWFEARVPLPIGDYRVMFAGKNYYKGTTSGGHVAIASVAILDGDCGKTVFEEMKVDGDCGFEDGTSMCGYRYTNESTIKLLAIRTESLSQSEQQQRSQRQIPSDTFLVMNHRFYQITNHGSRARLQSPELHIDSEGCLYLWYFNSVQSTTEDGNALNVFQCQTTGSESLLFRLPIQRSYRDKWYRLTGALPGGQYRLILEAIYSNEYSENTYVGFDNIEIFNRSCSEIESLPDSCAMAAASKHSTCLNGGTCTSLGKKSFRCTCVDGFYGDRCNFRFPCRDTKLTCANGGVCVNDGRMKAVCQCASGFTGVRCEERKKCGSPEDIVSNARAKPYINDAYQTRVDFECLHGYLQTEQVHAVCSADGIWYVHGECRLFTCGQPQQFAFHLNGWQQNGWLVNVTNTSLNGQARYECDAGYTPYNGQDVLRCLLAYGYSWNREFAWGNWRRTDGSDRIHCQPIPRCGVPAQLRNARLINYTSELLNGLASYECADGFQFNVNVSGRMVCSYNSQWTYVEAFQCWSVPDCGLPPNITNGRIVRISNTTEFGTAEYRCDIGYRVEGILKASCLRIGTDPLVKYFDWLFVPSCMPSCSANVGEHGNASIAVLEVAECSSSSFERFLPMMPCSNHVRYSVRRKPGKKLRNDDKETVVFYGHELCLGVPVRRLQYYRGNVVLDVARCKNFCLRYPTDVQYVSVLEEVSYTKKGDSWSVQSSHYHHQTFQSSETGTTTKRKIFRYQI